MFSWNFAKSAEAILSRYAIKRLCKFLLKKKLGKFIHGDIDLDQLDVQLSAGLLQLTDLALNVDYLNQKLGKISVFRVKEGSIRSLLIKMPWNGEGCEVEVDELELVLFPFDGGNSQEVVGTHDSNENYHVNNDMGTVEHDMVYKSAAASVNVHEGVKTVAKMVKWLLTSFCIRIKSVIVAFDAEVGRDKEEGSHDALVFRLAEIECGTCISEDKSLIDGSNSEDFLGISHLTNFLKFQGATVELLQIYSGYNQTHLASKPLLTGERGGFCGSMKLSIPWKNGSLDTCKVDAEVNVDTVIAKLQPSTLKWIQATWDLLEKYENNKVDDVNHMSVDTVVSDSTSQCSPSAFPSSVLSDKYLTPEFDSSLKLNLSSREEMVTDVLLKESCFISDWVPFYNGNYDNPGIEEANLGASVDQFFECLDELRSSQFMGSSGMWNWTCSVFSAITAASNLASGSLNVGAEQQHVQTNLKINLVGLSTILAFSDEDQSTQRRLADEQGGIDFDAHHLCLNLQDILIDVQVYLQEWKLETTVKRFVLDEHFSQKESADFTLYGEEKGLSDQTLMIQALQDKVLGVLPSNCLFSEPLSMVFSDATKLGNAPSSLSSTQNCACGNNTVKATLFETSGASQCLLAVSSRSFDGQSTTKISFSLKLPPFILWLNFDVVNMVLEFSRALVNSATKEEPEAVFASGAFEEKHKSSIHSDVTSTSFKGSLAGGIFLPHAKIILCFPLMNGGGLKSYVSCDQFIALDFSSPSNSKKLKAEGSTFFREDTPWKIYTPSPSHSVQLNVVNLDVYHIVSAVDDDAGKATELESQKLCSHLILALGNGTHWVSLISMLWHKDAVTGPWITKIAKVLATSDGSAGKMSSATSDYEFTSVSTRDKKGDLSSQKQKELILSSKFFLHIGVPVMVVTLRRSQYLCFFDLLSQAMDALTSAGSDTAYENRGTSLNQSSVLLECGLAKIHIELDQGDCLKSSLQRELPGSWHRLRLEIQNLQLLSVSDVGAISGASFLWVSHREGKLWGSITSLADQDVLLISCSDSSNGRGDGEGSNVLSYSHAGFDIVHMSDPESLHNHMSIRLKCGTIVAPGGRLDWLDKILSFFSLPSPVTGENVKSDQQKGDSQRLFFVLKFIDVALSYEPYLCELEVSGECLNSKSRISVNLDDDSCEPYIACLLAASSFTLSSTMVAGNLVNDYSIRFQDVGLLVHVATKQERLVGEYGVKYLHKLGYVKVAREALVDAILRINCENDVKWELNCSESHVVISTCHDTTLGLIRLASQLQQLYAPDMEESLVHLQNRWNSLKQVQGEDVCEGVSETSSNSSPRKLKVQQLGPDSKFDSGLVGLMGEISEDAFLFSGKSMSPSDLSELNTVEGNDSDLFLEGHSFTYPCHGVSMEDGHSSILQKTEIMEGYCLSDLRSLSELTINSHFPEVDSQSNTESRANVDVQRGKCGWYGSTSLSILENYVPDQTGQSHSKQLLEGKRNHEEGNVCQRFKGRLLLDNVDIKWRMYAGSDWHDLEETVWHSADICGRDEAICLELSLSNMNVHYDVFPDGDLCASKLCLSIQDLHIYDKSRNAPWKLVLGYYHSKDRPRQSFSKAFKLDLEAVRPDPTTPLEEYRLRIAVLPILLHLHQSQLDFLISFFGGKYSSDDSSNGDAQCSGSSDVSTAEDSKLKALSLVDEALLPYFQKFDIRPIILRVDYCPNRVDLAALSGGKYVELVNLVPWKGVELHLKHVQAAGIYGWGNVCETTLGEWLEDISQNQIHKLLRGLPAIRSFVAVGSGAAKLVSLPVKNYRRDHRLVKGLQRGTVAFLRSISVEALGLGVHLAAGAHEILLHAECIVTRIQPSLPHPVRRKVKKKRGSDQPEDAQHGLRRAYESLSDGLGKTASALIHTPMKAYQRGGGASSAIVSAVRGAPVAAIAPASAAAQALHCALLGVRNSLDLEHKEESLNKYLGPSRSWEQS
ncbi:autophagy-related protein 2-like [Chenopodium quinoa]|uniref:autophagy-related protein 2-like n=1 Tax=Chenopodium quinoa TaxID=63459 RepID=UPI000B78F18F|nr:autophagy-related protein 2-like [Chenopodium quinoa]